MEAMCPIAVNNTLYLMDSQSLIAIGDRNGE